MPLPRPLPAEVDAALQSLREAWAYVPRWRALLDEIVRHRDHAVAGGSLERSLVAASSAASSEDRQSHMLDALLTAVVHAPSLSLLDSLENVGGRAGLMRSHALLAGLLRAPSAALRERAALLSWKARRLDHRPLPASLRSVLSAVWAESGGEGDGDGEGGMRLYAALALLHDAEAGEEWLDFVWGCALPAGFSEASGLYDTETTTCARSSRYAAGEEGDGGSPRYVGAHCHACGSREAATTTRTYHQLDFYSIGFFEDHEIHCARCGFYTHFHCES